MRSGILDFLHSADSHPSAEEVHLAMKRIYPSVSFGTVYRNLNILVDQGEAQRLESSRGRDHFDGMRPFHAHFRCNECGGIYDLPLAPEGIAREMAEKTGHEIRGHHIEFTGICSACRKKS